VRIYGGIRSEYDWGPGGMRPFEVLTLDMRGFDGFAQELFFPAVLAPVFNHPVTSTNIHDQGDIVLNRQFNTFIVDIRTVLNRVSSGENRIFDRLGAVRVSRHFQSCCVGNFNNSLYFLTCHFWLTWNTAIGQHGTGGDHFQYICTVFNCPECICTKFFH